MIPKVIHYCWFGKNPLPKDVKKCIESWKKFCPDYEIKQWDESNFDVYQNDFVKSAYENKAWAFVSDYARLKIVYDEGGIYLDTDVELLRNLDSLLENKCYVAIQQQDNVIATGLGFGAEKQSFAVSKMLEEYNNLQFDINKKNSYACPWLNTKAINTLGEFKLDAITYLADVTIYPPEYFDPIAPGNTKNLLCNRSFSIHHYAATWTNKANILKRRFIRILGQKNVNKIKNYLK